MNFYPVLEGNSIVSTDGNIRITHRVEKRMRAPAQSAVYPVPYLHEWEEFDRVFKDSTVMNLQKYFEGAERRLRSPNSGNQGVLNNKDGEEEPAAKKPRMSLKDTGEEGETCTIECIGLCVALREMREKRIARRKAAFLRKKAMKDAGN